MATGEASLGLVGLTHNVNKRESARQDLATMGQLVQMKKQQEAEEQQAALVEQQYYEQIKQQADQMLAGDRKRINEKAKSIQGQIREQIKAFGGSRAKFMASGGVAMIGDYTRNVLESKEVALYKQNKINLEKLLDIKEKGMGGQISPRDQASLDDYNKNGFGEISYSGLKNTIELPDEGNYYEGQYATPMDILLYENNKTKILGNYKIDNPDVPIETMPVAQREHILRQYTALNYSVRGKKALPQYPNGSTGNSPRSSGKLTEDGYSVSTVAGELYTHKAKYNEGITLEDMKKSVFDNAPYATEVFGGVRYNKKSKTDSTLMQKLGDVATIPLGNGLLWKYDEENTFSPRGAMDLGANLNLPFWQLQNGKDDYIIEQGVVKDLKPQDLSNLMWGNGVPIQQKELEDLKNGDYKIKGSFLGYQMNARGQDYMVVDAYTNDGKLDIEKNESMYINEDPNNPSKGKQEIFIELEGPDGKTIYQKVDFSGSNHANLLNKYLGDAADLSDQYAEDKQNATSLRQAEELTGGQRRSQAIMNIDHNAFESSPAFNEQLKYYNNYIDTGNRVNLLKGFYTALFDLKTDREDQNLVDMENLIEQNSLGQLLYGLGLDQKIKDPRMSDMDFYNLMRQTILNSEHSRTPEEAENNTFLMDKLRNYMLKARAPRERETKPKAQFGADFGYTPGSEWQVVKDFKGPSHEGGGIDVNVNNL